MSLRVIEDHLHSPEPGLSGWLGYVEPHLEIQLLNVVLFARLPGPIWFNIRDYLKPQQFKQFLDDFPSLLQEIKRECVLFPLKQEVASKYLQDSSSFREIINSRVANPLLQIQLTLSHAACNSVSSPSASFYALTVVSDHYNQVMGQHELKQLLCEKFSTITNFTLAEMEVVTADTVTSVSNTTSQIQNDHLRKFQLSHCDCYSPHFTQFFEFFPSLYHVVLFKTTLSALTGLGEIPVLEIIECTGLTDFSALQKHQCVIIQGSYEVHKYPAEGQYSISTLKLIDYTEYNDQDGFTRPSRDFLNRWNLAKNIEFWWVSTSSCSYIILDTHFLNLKIIKHRSNTKEVPVNSIILRSAEIGTLTLEGGFPNRGFPNRHLELEDFNCELFLVGNTLIKECRLEGCKAVYLCPVKVAKLRSQKSQAPSKIEYLQFSCNHQLFPVHSNVSGETSYLKVVVKTDS